MPSRLPLLLTRRALIAVLLASSLIGTEQCCSVAFASSEDANANASSGTAKSAKPNIVIILADDLGYGSTTPYGAPDDLVKTPNIDRLAKEGIRFTQAYTGSSVCSPTRYGLLTGQYAFRTSLKRGVLNTFAPLLLSNKQLNLANLLDAQGYNTAAVGKWHLGYGDARSLDGRTDYRAKLSPGPLDIGFDYHFGVPSNHGDLTGIFVENYYTYGLKDGRLEEGAVAEKVIGRPADDDNRFQSEYAKSETEAKRLDGIEIKAPRRKNDRVMDVLTDKTVQWLEKQTADQPFFLYYTPVAVHNPVTPSPEVAGTSKAGVYGDWIHELDRSVGHVLDALDRKGLTSNTLVLFTSDNGGVFRPNNKNLVQTKAFESGLKVNGDLRGGKHTVYEGGFRVPYILRWPNRIQPGSTSDQIVSLVDTLASVASITGQTIPSPEQGAPDSYDVTSAWTGVASEQVRRDVIVHSADGVFAIRKENWKWIEGIPAPGGNLNDPARLEEHKPQLYNLATDPQETTDLSEEHPEVVNELKALLNRYRNGLYSRELPNSEVAPEVAGIPSITAPVEKLPEDPWRILRGKWEVKDGGLSVTVAANQTAAIAVDPAKRLANVSSSDNAEQTSATESAQELNITYESQLIDAERVTVRVDTGENRSYRFDINEHGIQIVKNDSDGRDGPDKQEIWGTSAAKIEAGKWCSSRIEFNNKKVSFQVEGEGVSLVLDIENDLVGENRTQLSWVIAGGTASLKNVHVK